MRIGIIDWKGEDAASCYMKKLFDFGIDVLYVGRTEIDFNNKRDSFGKIDAILMHLGNTGEEVDRSYYTSVFGVPWALTSFRNDVQILSTFDLNAFRPLEVIKYFERLV
jgi:hypothetical protein